MSRPADLDQRLLFEDVWLNGLLEERLDAVYPDGAVPGRLAGVVSGPRLTYTKLALARASSRTSRATGRGGGTAAPGRLLLRMAPGAIATMARRLSGGVALVSATNGKTTTARMLAAILEADGHAVVHNRAGANTHWGVTTALSEQEGDVGVFEVDEAWLGLLATELRPRLLVLGNLFRDRLDGYGEVDRLVALWRALVRRTHPPAVVVANADDALLAGPGGVIDGAPTAPVLFGLEAGVDGARTPGHPHEAHTCAACGGRLRYERAFVAHLGHYSCAGCGRGRPPPSVRGLALEEEGLDGTSATLAVAGEAIDVQLSLPGRHNVYNALAAAAAATALGVGRDAIRAGLQSVLPPFGRGEKLQVDGTDVYLLLVKNPVGVNATLRLLVTARAPRPLHVWMALNDGQADGRDVSWIWDADFERLALHAGSATCSGARAPELALRLKYAGWRCPIDVQEDLDESFRRAIAQAPGALVALPTYSALLGLRDVLRRLGVAVTDWR